MGSSKHLRRFDATIARLERRVDRTLEQCRRFEEMAEVLQVWADHWTTETLERWLYLDDISREEREKALVALALQATNRAGRVIAEYDPGPRGSDHQTFHQVARIEWEQRQQVRGRRLA
ncbi:MAG: hypothetical protein ACOCV2_14600 [Persicimonas sp.]